MQLTTHNFDKGLKNEPGTYAIVLKSNEDQEIHIGKLGKVNIHDGYYVYVGSAFGPGGIKTRVGHHAAITNKPHWHMDYLRKATELIEVWYTYGKTRYEHIWADALQLCHGASIPFPGFGSSDCQCISHLIFFKTMPSYRQFIKLILEQEKISNNIEIHRLEC